MRELNTEVEIGAPAEVVWRVLTDFESFPQWNPFIRRLKGRAEKGERLEVRLQPPGGMGMTLRPAVLASVPGREFRWLGKLLLPNLFDGEHIFQIEPAGPGHVIFRQRELFRGVLVPLLWPVLEKSTRRGFEEMNSALKARAESAAAISWLA